MAALQSNILVKVVAGIAAVMLVFLIIKSIGGSKDKGESVSQMEAVPELNQKTADADTTAETVKTLTAEVQELKETNLELQRKNEKLLKQEEKISLRVRERVKQDITSEMTAKDAMEKREQERKFNDLKQQFETLAGKMNLDKLNGKRRANADEEFPIGLGLNGEEPGKAGDSSRGEWLMPLDTDLEETVGNMTGGVNNKDPNLRKTSTNTQKKNAEDDITPQYTIPKGGSLLKGVAFTALLGRIPIDGRVTDPFPFKVLVGPENLAANGIVIPGLKGMIFGGIATGDWNLECVRGDFKYATYVFEDGRISTFSGEGGKEQSIGYLSNPQGIPCVPGELKTNAMAYLTSKIGLAALETAGEGFAAASTNTQFNTAGGATVDIEDVGDYTLGKLVSGGASETKKWVDERQSQSFDAVFARPGVEIAVNVEIEIPIDIDINERKVAYGQEGNPYKSANLD